MTSSSSTPPRTAYYAGLDGLRALAVILVVLYHLFPGWIFRSGFVGVDVFFVISGFLITSLLLRERASTGRIALFSFWRRRARRLLPALALLLTVCSSLAWLVGGDVLVRLGQQLLSAVTFSYNWASIAEGASYFNATTPELFRNLWSLAVEEQFYVLWPLALPLFLLLPRTRARVLLAATLAVASAAWMAVLVATGGDLTRAYFGTESHGFGLLIGVALAFGLQHVLATPRQWMHAPRIRTSVEVVGGIATAALIGVALLPEVDGIASFPGVLVAASILTGIALIAGTWPGSRIGSALDAPAFRWIGRRSYGLYLWHWPLLVLLTAATVGHTAASDVPVTVGISTAVLTLACAALSYRYLEVPIRRYGFRMSLSRFFGRLRGKPTTRFGAITAITACVIALGGTSAAIAAAPAATSSEAVVAAGAAALDRAAKKVPPAPISLFPKPLPALAPIEGDQITAVGDSVMLASAPALIERYPGIAIDAAVSRSMWQGVSVLQDLAQSGQLRDHVIVALGTNGAIDSEALDSIESIVGPSRQLILVNAFAPRDWIEGVNSELARFSAVHRNVELADWSGAISPHVDLLAGDQIHPSESGGRIFCDTIDRAMKDLQRSQLARAGQDLLP
ncbi:peptidoglycan/LPS O-acetylase OafA/YrhL [Microbacterium endophyticum]|uniref:Peptidoglycan/LPS O-acetylase OafA/YrhL n=1 Tax=Microbacterium endophyticum TaxID=1526412 RepID=A0A7W4V259_9MICO|nr:acyltransferase family protein [Microbacterium endophyticum]MBB2975462.1 peptidoglycan/LPS O-acetylase OafA/YrhL [Microbacterium endophyticum]NIK35519.1 peptidoglycan/LPS O-acetylase OafA/YrhL [Microbacterium endophyticum]